MEDGHHNAVDVRTNLADACMSQRGEGNDTVVSTGSAFVAIWESLSEVMGTPTAAILLERARSRAARRDNGLNAVAIKREGFDYRYEMPEAWLTTVDKALMGTLIAELVPLLTELTGQLVVNRLAKLEILRKFATEQEVATWFGAQHLGTVD
jgi:hypothetical protein